MGHYLFSRNSCKRKKKEIVACERRTSTRRKSCGRIFLANGHYTFHPSMFKTFLPFRSMREFFLPTSIFLSRSNSSTLNFPLLSVRLSTTNLKMSQLGVARIRKFVLRWKKKKKKKTFPRNYCRVMHPTFNDKHNKNPPKNSLRYVSEGNNPKLCHSFYFFLG